MTKHTLQVTYVWLMVAAHLTGAVFSFFAFTKHGLTFEQLTTVLSIITPIFSVHAGTAVGWLLKAEAGDKGYRKAKEKIGPNLTVFSLAIPVLLMGGLVLVMYLHAWTHTFGSFENLKYVLLAVEGLLGGFLGSVMQLLFRPTSTPADQSPSKPSDT